MTSNDDFEFEKVRLRGFEEDIKAANMHTPGTALDRYLGSAYAIADQFINTYDRPSDDAIRLIEDGFIKVIDRNVKAAVNICDYGSTPRRNILPWWMIF